VLALGSPAHAGNANWLSVGKDGWLPSLAFTAGVSIQNQKAEGESSCAFGGGGREPFTLGPQDFGVPACLGLADPETNDLEPGMADLRNPISGEDVYVAPGIGINLELATPAVGVIPGDPRFFAQGGVDFYFGVLKNTAIEGDPIGVALPELAMGLPENAPVFALLGTGSHVQTQIQRVGWSAGGGIAFPFEFLGRRLWIKPGAAWARQSLDLDFRVEAGVKNDPISGPNAFGKSGDQIRYISLRAEDTLTVDGLGPSLEIEMDVIDFGPIGASLFITGAAYKVLGDRKVEASTMSELFPATEPTTCCLPMPPRPGVPPRGLPEDQYSADWSFEVDPWFYRAYVGLRFHWIGF